jgi:FkbM family methyltransferase
MITTNLRTVKNNNIEIKIENPIIANHFLSRINCTTNILQQFNEKIYDEFLKNKNGINILDCGGNIGLFALHVYECAANVISVEPTPNHIDIFKELTKNYPNIKLIEAALSPQNKEIDFYFCTENTTMNSLANNYNSGSIKVSGKTLKTILDENNLDIIHFAKIDIEGSEMLALTDETILEVKDKIKSFFVEFHDVGDKRIKENRENLTKIFNNNGYNTTFIGHDSLFCWK